MTTEPGLSIMAQMKNPVVDRGVFRVLANLCLLVGVSASSLSADQTGDDIAPRDVIGPDTLFLTWFDDPTRSIVVQWLQRGDLVPLAEGASDVLPAVEVPRLEGVDIDGDLNDWDGNGGEIGFLADRGRTYDPQDIDAEAWLGWDGQSLLVAVRVRDDRPVEALKSSELWSADSVELFFSTGVGSDQRYQVILSPGRDPERPKARHWHYDYRRDRSSGRPDTTYAFSQHDQGYQLEARLPWKYLGIDPEAGITAAIQVYINDRDGEQAMKTISWHIDRDAHENPESMHQIRLAETSEEVGWTVQAELNSTHDAPVLDIYADTAYAGTQVVACSGSITLGKASFTEEEGRAVARVLIPEPPSQRRWGTITLRQGADTGRLMGYVTPPRWMNAARPQPVEVKCVSLAETDRGTADVEAGASWSAHTTVKPFGVRSGLFVHRVEFDQLEPGHEYILSLGSPHEVDGLRFRTAPAALDRPLVFAEGGDVGTGPKVAPLHRIAASWDPLFGLIGGDCAYANGRTAERWVDYLRLWRANMVDSQGRLIPMLCAIGNHEVDGSFGQPRERAPLFLALFDGLFPEHTHAVVDFGDYLSLVLLDSGHLCAHDGEQRDWLEQVLPERTDRPHLMTAYHVPAYPSHREFEGRYSEQARQHWVPLFDRYGVDVAFEHHDHTYKRTHKLTAGQRDPNGVLYVGDGAWGVEPRTVATPEERPFLSKSVSASHVIRVTLEPGSRHFMAVDVAGNEIDQFSDTEREPAAP
ncbi:MAG: hypothetical protein Kow00105_10670 [Phycisphaeraceae bacterium]